MNVFSYLFTYIIFTKSCRLFLIYLFLLFIIH